MFGQRRIFFEGGVNIRKPRPVQRIPPQIAVGARGGKYEGVRIEILLRASQNDISFESRINGWANRISGISVVRWVESELRREWEAALHTDDAAHGPARNEILGSVTHLREVRFATSEGEFIRSIDD